MVNQELGSILDVNCDLRVQEPDRQLRKVLLTQLNNTLSGDQQNTMVIHTVQITRTLGKHHADYSGKEVDLNNHSLTHNYRLRTPPTYFINLTNVDLLHTGVFPDLSKNTSITTTYY